MYSIHEQDNTASAFAQLAKQMNPSYETFVEATGFKNVHEVLSSTEPNWAKKRKLFAISNTYT